MLFVGLNESKNFDLTVKKLVNLYKALWDKTETSMPVFSYSTGYFQRLFNEWEIERFRKKLKKEIKTVPNSKAERDILSEKIFLSVETLEKKIIGENKGLIKYFSAQGYADITEQFLNEVKEFDSNMNFYDIFQAIRNVWIMNSIQILFDMPVKLTPSIFSYSMLYPYSDNYLDDVNITGKEKLLFNKRFRAWLYGEKVKPLGELELNIYNLVNKIYKEFPRQRYPQVLQSLLAIHSAQEKSVFQQHIQSNLCKDSILDISFEKGGTSVLADGYLVKGNLTNSEQYFLFGYGLLLQLIDDLQDVKEDIDSSSVTVFSQQASKGTLDSLTSKLFNFVEVILSNDNVFLSEKALQLKGIIQASCIAMIVEAISKNKDMYSKAYLKEIEKHSLVRLPYYQKLQQKLRVQYSDVELNNVFTSFSN